MTWLLYAECEALENFEALMALGNLASLNESVRARIIKDGNTIQAIENYMFDFQMDIINYHLNNSNFEQTSSHQRKFSEEMDKEENSAQQSNELRC